MEVPQGSFLGLLFSLPLINDSSENPGVGHGNQLMIQIARFHIFHRNFSFLSVFFIKFQDSVVDLVSGLGAPLSKLVISAPVQAFRFTLQNEEYTAPGSPALEVKSLTRNELCKIMKGATNWTLERDEDQTGPYIFR